MKLDVRALGRGGGLADALASAHPDGLLPSLRAENGSAR